MATPNPIPDGDYLYRGKSYRARNNVLVQIDGATETPVAPPPGFLDASYVDPDTPTTLSVAEKTAISVTPLAPTALADTPTITWATNGVPSPLAKVTLAGNRTLSLTGVAAGQMGTLIVTQDATGGRTLALPAGSLVLRGPFALAAGPNAVTVLSYLHDGTRLIWSFGAAT